jgi:hypothetical protein
MRVYFQLAFWSQNGLKTKGDPREKLGNTAAFLADFVFLSNVFTGGQ